MIHYLLYLFAERLFSGNSSKSQWGRQEYSRKRLITMLSVCWHFLPLLCKFLWTHCGACGTSKLILCWLSDGWPFHWRSVKQGAQDRSGVADVAEKYWGLQELMNKNMNGWNRWCSCCGRGGLFHHNGFVPLKLLHLNGCLLALAGLINNIHYPFVVYLNTTLRSFPGSSPDTLTGTV